ncbi:Na+/H+ antiporter NhaC family protein [Senegalimassilia anaerobia]|uniref:Na+/H+ antiporter NhaC family protein n=1 Tax=Senegalimassilia anaerobia TaxID=1473216 RepID=UPI001D78BB13|nr:Na+/H+ antiporter NhaC family protein [Senegalimassilia anaerobia]MBD9214704.1 Na+/H+ antiporter NhaC family protein [Senegalimassilia anaerobia]
MEEAFELISTGAWSIVPPLLALALALITKEVYSSLTIGVFVGMVIYQFTLNGVGVDQLVTAFTDVPNAMALQIADNGALLLFLALLGALTVVIATAGGSRAYAEWVSTHIKNARAAQVLTGLLGIIIFVDDYFNCLTVGAVMRPVTDRFHVSHEKLAWIIDSTAAPVCIIAPVSSWAVAVGGYLGDDGFTTFVQSIPYNFYALLTIFFVFFMLITNKNDYGPMRAAEAEAKTSEDAAAEGGKLLEKLSTMGLSDQAEADPDDHTNLESVVTEQADIEQSASAAIDEYKGLDISEKGKVYDLIVPILVLIFFSILGMMYTGGFFEGVDFATAVGENPVGGLCIGATVALCVAGAMFLPRGLTTLSGFVESISEGVRSMVGAIMILVLAWSLGGCCRYMLGTGDFVSSFLNSLGVSLAILPCIIFLVAGFIGFAMGTSWGTIALILPIVVGVFNEGDPLFLVAVGATLAGAVYGDHISPISDTTILSSAGAKCNHLRHVATQLPYATTVMVVCFVCYIVAGFTGNPWISLVLGAVLIVVAVKILHKSNIGMKK